MSHPHSRSKNQSFRSEPYLIILSNAILLITTLSCGISHVKLVGDDNQYFLIALTINFLTSAVSLCSAGPETSPSNLVYLLEYIQLALVFPCFTADVVLKHDVLEPEFAFMFPCLGCIAAFFYLIHTYQREDLTDLANVFSIICCLIVGILEADMGAICASAIYAVGYLSAKRNDAELERTLYKDIYILVTAMFTFLAFICLSFSRRNRVTEFRQWIPNVPNPPFVNRRVRASSLNTGIVSSIRDVLRGILT